MYYIFYYEYTEYKEIMQSIICITIKGCIIYICTLTF